MTHTAKAMNAHDLEFVFPGESETAQLLRQINWNDHKLGPTETWDPPLRAAIEICLMSRFAMCIYWGPEHHIIYNDAYISVLSHHKHPHCLGRPLKEVWAEVYDKVTIMFTDIQRNCEPVCNQDQILFLMRNTADEETFLTYSISPFSIKEQAAGLCCIVVETTEKIIGNRRLNTLRNLGVGIATAANTAAVCVQAASVLEQNYEDIPFAAIYLYDQKNQRLSLCSTANIPDISLLTEGINLSDVSATNLPFGDLLQQRSMQ